MKHFARPRSAVTDIAQMPVGTRVWYVCGIWPPFVEGPYEVLSEPELHETTDSLFINLAYLDFDGTHKTAYNGTVVTDHHSLTDGNVGVDNRYNDNYFFLSAEAAERARRWIEFQYELAPDALASERSRRIQADEYL